MPTPTDKTYDAIIVGGGPAGAACAWRLNRAGLDCLLLERAEFPRTKLCAGWITPEVVADLGLAADGSDYPHRFITFEQIHVHLRKLRFKLNSRQHSIRRYEFDDWLLRRAGIAVVQHYAKSIERQGGEYLIDDRYRAKYLVGAGGTKCPVYRSLFRAANPRAKELQAATLEQEFPYDWQDPACHLWFFDHGLPGYSWYVPKENGYLNVGIGGMAYKLKNRSDDLKNQWSQFTQDLARAGLVRGVEFNPGGYSYYLRTDVDTIRVDNAFIVGDAIGLATRDLCEGIGPAVRSGLLAADAIVDPSRDYSLDTIGRYSLGKGLMPKFLEYMFINRREKVAAPRRREAA